MKIIGGRTFVKVDGEQLLVVGDVTTNIGQTVVRETVTGIDQVHGVTEKAVANYIQIKVTEVPEFPLSRLNRIIDSTVTLESPNGRSWVLSNAAQVGELDLNPEDGSIASVRFEGRAGDEVTRS